MQPTSTTFVAASRNAMVAATALLAAHVALAVNLVPGVPTALPGTTLADQSFLAGTVLEDVTIPVSVPVFCGGGCQDPFLVVSTVTGTAQSRVVRETAAGTLDFYWRITNDASTDPFFSIRQFRLDNFLSTSYDANWRIDGLGNTAPTSALLWPAPLDGTIFFSFVSAQSSGIAAGDGSYFLLMHTSATQYAASASFAVEAGTIDFGDEGGSSGPYATFAPLAVPEPQQSVLLAVGLGAVGLAARRRKRAAQGA